MLTAIQSLKPLFLLLTPRIVVDLVHSYILWIVNNILLEYSQLLLKLYLAVLAGQISTIGSLASHPSNFPYGDFLSRIY